MRFARPQVKDCEGTLRVSGEGDGRAIYCDGCGREMPYREAEPPQVWREIHDGNRCIRSKDGERVVHFDRSEMLGLVVSYMGKRQKRPLKDCAAPAAWVVYRGARIAVDALSGFLGTFGVSVPNHIYHAAAEPARFAGGDTVLGVLAANGLLEDEEDEPGRLHASVPLPDDMDVRTFTILGKRKGTVDVPAVTVAETVADDEGQATVPVDLAAAEAMLREYHALEKGAKEALSEGEAVPDPAFAAIESADPSIRLHVLYRLFGAHGMAVNAGALERVACPDCH